MSQTPSARRAAIAQQFSHYVIGFAIVMKGVEKAEHFSDYPGKVVTLFLLGGFVMAGAALHRRLHTRVRNVEAIFHLCEAAALAVSGVVLLEKGSVRIPYFLFVLALLYTILGVVRLVVPQERHVLISRLLVYTTAPLLLVAGVVALGLNYRGGANPWVYAIGTLFLVGGAGLLVFRRALIGRPEARPDRQGAAT